MANVLLIEPDTVLAHTYTQALQHVHHTVVHVRTAQEAIQAADEQVPDIVVLELRLTVHDGIEFLHEFRSYAEWQQIPVVINTSMSPSLLRNASIALEQDMGVSKCLYKPRVSLEQLIRVVNEQVQVA